MKTYYVRYSDELDLGTGDLLADFSCPWESEPVPRTGFRAVANDSTLKFEFEVEDPDLVLKEDSDEGLAALGSDRVELFFASSPDLTQPYFGAEMDPRGFVYDYKALYYRQIDPDWSFETLSYQGELGAGGYSVTGTFSLEELKKLGCLKRDKMITGVYRAEFSHGGNDDVIEKWICWVDPKTESPDFHVPASFGKWIFESA